MSHVRLLFQDTLFGACVRFITRGKVLGWEEVHNEELREKYIHSDRNRKQSEAGQSSDDELEKGRDYQLVEFLENDPMVKVIAAPQVRIS